MTAKNKDNLMTHEEVQALITVYSKLVEEGVNERWKLIDHDLMQHELYDVIGGLLARQANLTISFAYNPGIWSPHISPLVYRAQIDAYINLAWILESDSYRRSQMYVQYGLGQEKLQIAHLRNESVDKDKITQDFIEAREIWLNGQLNEELADVDLGSWSGANTRKMAEEAHCLDLYNLAYQTFSTGAHNMWPHVGRHDLKICNNPLHKGHRLPYIWQQDDGDMYPLIISSKYMQKAFELIDTKLKLTCDTQKPMTYLLERLGLIGS